MIKLVIFDLDGTAVDTLESLAYSVNRVMRRLGLREMPVENFKYYAGDGARKMIKRCLKDAGDPTASRLEDALDIYREEFKKGCTYHVKPFPGLTETLEDLREYGVFLAICTNKGQSYAEAVIKKVYGRICSTIFLEKDPVSPENRIRRVYFILQNIWESLRKNVSTWVIPIRT